MFNIRTINFINVSKILEAAHNSMNQYFSHDQRMGKTAVKSERQTKEF